MFLLLLLFILVKQSGQGLPVMEHMQDFYKPNVLQNWTNRAGDFANQTCLVIGFAGCGDGSAANVCSHEAFDAFVNLFQEHLALSLAAQGLAVGGAFCSAQQMAQEGQKGCLPPLVVRSFHDPAEMEHVAMTQVRQRREWLSAVPCRAVWLGAARCGACLLYTSDAADE